MRSPRKRSFLPAGPARPAPRSEIQKNLPNFEFQIFISAPAWFLPGGSQVWGRKQSATGERQRCAAGASSSSSQAHVEEEPVWGDLEGLMGFWGACGVGDGSSPLLLLCFFSPDGFSAFPKAVREGVG